MKYLYGAIILVVLIGIFIFSYLLNKRTPKPEGCQNLDECEGCQLVSCSHHPSNNKEGNDK